MNQNNSSKIHLVAAIVGMAFSSMAAGTAQAAIDFYQTGASGSGIQTLYAPLTPVSGLMQATAPKFNPGLGTLIQADFEFAASATGTWVSTVPQTGTSTLSLSGQADVDGQAMGNLAIGFTDTYDNVIGSNSFDSDFVNLTVTSGAFFNTLTGPGTVLMSWLFSGSTTLDTPAAGTGPGGEGFSWGGSIHVTYTYEPVPEPSTLLLCVVGGTCTLLAAGRRRRKKLPTT